MSRRYTRPEPPDDVDDHVVRWLSQTVSLLDAGRLDLVSRDLLRLTAVTVGGRLWPELSRNLTACIDGFRPGAPRTVDDLAATLRLAIADLERQARPEPHPSLSPEVSPELSATPKPRPKAAPAGDPEPSWRTDRVANPTRSGA